MEVCVIIKILMFFCTAAFAAGTAVTCIYRKRDCNGKVLQTKSVNSSSPADLTAPAKPVRRWSAPAEIRSPMLSSSELPASSESLVSSELPVSFELPASSESLAKLGTPAPAIEEEGAQDFDKMKNSIVERLQQSVNSKLNLSERVECTDNLMTTLFKMMQCASEADEMNKVVEFCENELEKCASWQQIEDEIFSKALKESKKALANAKSTEDSTPSEQMKYAIQAMENIEVMVHIYDILNMQDSISDKDSKDTNNIDWNNIFGIMRESIEIMVKLMVDSQKKDNVAGVKEFGKAVLAVFDVWQSFRLEDGLSKFIVISENVYEYVSPQNRFKAIQQKIDTLLQCASKMNCDALVVGARVSYIIDKIQRAIYGSQIIDTVLCCFNFRMPDLAQTRIFDAFMMLKRAVKNLEGSIDDGFYSIENLDFECVDTTPEIIRKSMKRGIESIEKHIIKIKKKSGKMNAIINGVIEAITEEKQAKMDYEKKRGAEDFIRDPEQEFSIRAYILQKWIAEYRQHAIDAMRMIYDYEQYVIVTKEKIADLKKKLRA